jgi:hypothetical protein
VFFIQSKERANGENADFELLTPLNRANPARRSGKARASFAQQGEVFAGKIILKMGRASSSISGKNCEHLQMGDSDSGSG